MTSDTRKIVINACFGGFGLSEEAVVLYARRKGMNVHIYNDGLVAHYYNMPEGAELPARPRKGLDLRATWDEERMFHDEIKRIGGAYFSDTRIGRDDPDLVAVVEELGSEAAGGRYSELRVVEIPADVAWHIEEYDGLERVAEDHRTWE